MVPTNSPFMPHVSDIVVPYSCHQAHRMKNTWYGKTNEFCRTQSIPDQTGMSERTLKEKNDRHANHRGIIHAS
jgi:hypothetical protein